MDQPQPTPEVPVEEPLEEEVTFDQNFESDLVGLQLIATSNEQLRLPTKQEYLESSVLPILLEGIAWIMNERPADPVEHLAMFLIKNNPNQSPS